MEDKIRSLIIDYVNNYMENPKVITRWKDPLVAFASA